MNKYLSNPDESWLAEELDNRRKEMCEIARYCTRCPFYLRDGKCVLVTASHHISCEYRKRFERMKKLAGASVGYQPTEPIRSKPPKTPRPKEATLSAWTEKDE